MSKTLEQTHKKAEQAFWDNIEKDVIDDGGNPVAKSDYAPMYKE
jgi:hypothetical protein